MVTRVCRRSMAGGIMIRIILSMATRPGPLSTFLCVAEKAKVTDMRPLWCPGMASIRGNANRAKRPRSANDARPELRDRLE